MAIQKTQGTTGRSAVSAPKPAAEAVKAVKAAGVKFARDEMSTGRSIAMRVDGAKRLGGTGGTDVAARQCQGVANAQAMLEQFGGATLTEKQLQGIRAGVGPGNWCGMFVGTALNLTPEAKLGIASTYRAITSFTQEGSGRQFFILEGTDMAGAQWQGHGPLPTQRYTPETLPIRPGDVVVFDDGFRGGTGHIGMVESYDPATGKLVTIEGNVDGGKVLRKEYDLTDPEVAAMIDGFGRPAASDFNP